MSGLAQGLSTVDNSIKTIAVDSDGKVMTSGGVSQAIKDNTNASEILNTYGSFSGVKGDDFITSVKTSNGQSFTALSISPLNDDVESEIIVNAPIYTPGAAETEASISGRFRHSFSTFCLFGNNEGGEQAALAPLEINTIYQSSATGGAAYNAVAGTTLTIVLNSPFMGYLSDWVHVYGLADNRLNYPNLCVNYISLDRKTITAGFSDEVALPSIAATYTPSAGTTFIALYQNLGGSTEGFGYRFTGTTSSSGVLVSRFNGGDVQVSGSLLGSHIAGVTLSSTSPTYNNGVNGQYEITANGKFRLESRPLDVTFQSKLNSLSAPPSWTIHQTRGSVKPAIQFPLKPRFRVLSPKSITRPVAKIVSAVKTGTTTATITTASNHGLVTNNWVTIKGNRDQTNFANFSIPVQVTVLSPTTFTCVYGTAVTANTYGGSVILTNGGVDQQGLVGQTIQSATLVAATGLAPDTLTLIGSANWSTGVGTMNIGDYMELHGVRIDLTGADLGVDGTWEVANISTNVLTLIPVSNVFGVRKTPVVSAFASTNCGGNVIHRVTLRSHDLIVEDWSEQRVTIDGQGTTRLDKSLPVNVTSSVTVTQSGTWNVGITGNPAIIGQAAEDAAATTSPVIVGGVARSASTPTTIVAGDVVRDTMALSGAKVVKEYSVPEGTWNANLALTTATAVAIQTAAGASLKRFPVAVQAINTGASAVDLIILDGVTERWRMTLPPNVPFVCTLPVELVVTANTALNANLSAVGTVRANFQGYTSP